jgi:hypothetical protein
LSSDAVVELVRLGWLILAFMMLLSRVVFQAAGPLRMRAFLDGWQNGAVKRFWGAIGLVYAAVVGVAGALAFGSLSTIDAVLFVGLLLVLAADGLVNVLPAGFETFKTKVQDAWVARHRGTSRESDRSLFGTVNALLALGSVAVAALVIAYRPIELRTLLVAAIVSFVLTIVLLGVSEQARKAAGARP